MDSNHVTNCHSPKSRGGPGLESPTHTPPTAYIWCQRGGMMLMDKNSRRVLVLEENNRHSSLDFRTTDFRTTDSEITDSRTTDSQTIWFTKLRKTFPVAYQKTF